MRKKKFLFIVPRLNEPHTAGENARKYMYYGVALMSSYLKKNGFLTDIIDCQGKEINNKELEEKLSIKKPDCIGISAIYGNMDEAYLLAQKCKLVFPKIKIILGGLPVTFAYERIFQECSFIDICIIGEGEETVLQLMKNKKIQKIKGIAFKEGEEIFINKKRQAVKNLDKYPFPDYSLFDSDDYKNKFVPYETSRGCPFACKFCCQGQKEGKKLREKSEEKVVSDFKKIAKMGFKKIMIVDNDFLTNMERAKNIFEKVIKERINEKIDLVLATRISNILRERKEIINLMYNANVRSVFVGVESLCGKNQKEIGKIRDVKELKELFEELLLFRIRALPSYIFGFPNETEKDMEETYKNALYLGTKIFKFNIFTPYPGTKLYQEMDSKGLINHNIPLSKYDNLHKVYYNKTDLEKIITNYSNSYLREIRKY